MNRAFLVVACLAFALIGQVQSHAAESDSAEIFPPPPSLEELQNVKIQKTPVVSAFPTGGMPEDIRIDAMREAALSYGARGGLSWRTYYIRQEMEGRAAYMDRVFDFRQLLISAPSGLLIEPPIITESVDAMMIQQGGQEAAVADRIYNIGRNARIVSTARTWRAYLERQWGLIAPPPDLLLPRNNDELQMFRDWVATGWQAGAEQADEIFQADLNKLASDYQGMVRYRMLLAQGMVSPPYALQVDRGVTGGGNEMRVGDRAVSITGLPQLQTGTQGWQPASR
jgi:defect in organelle trafficking protein DotC